MFHGAFDLSGGCCLMQVSNEVYAREVPQAEVPRTVEGLPAER